MNIWPRTKPREQMWNRHYQSTCQQARRGLFILEPSNNFCITRWLIYRAVADDRVYCCMKSHFRELFESGTRPPSVKSFSFSFFFLPSVLKKRHWNDSKYLTLMQIMLQRSQRRNASLISSYRIITTWSNQKSKRTLQNYYLLYV